MEHAVCTAWRMEQEVRWGVALGLEELWQAYARASNSAEAASILAAIQERVPEDLRPSGMDDTGQSEALEAAIQCATTAQASALDSLMAEEGWTEEEDFMEALDAAWQAANQCGDVVEAERLKPTVRAVELHHGVALGKAAQRHGAGGLTAVDDADTGQETHEFADAFGVAVAELVEGDDLLDVGGALALVLRDSLGAHLAVGDDVVGRERNDGTRGGGAGARQGGEAEQGGTMSWRGRTGLN